ncbi:hypothetical protein BD779DRAFT_1436539 [Infundibulicybe gibba]|nr:hypothetical protein BD779DRAFT_1436539 [Infundibulicybe gibba]
MASYPSSLKNKSLSYFDAARLFNDNNVKADLNAGCERLAQTLIALMGRFDAVTTQLHTIDLQGRTAPLKPRWHTIRKDFRELVRQCRANAGCVAGRAKMFNTVVLPLAARNLSATSSRARDERLQVVQSYMAVSTDSSCMPRPFLSHDRFPRIMPG